MKYKIRIRFRLMASSDPLLHYLFHLILFYFIHVRHIYNDDIINTYVTHTSTSEIKSNMIHYFATECPTSQKVNSKIKFPKYNLIVPNS